VTALATLEATVKTPALAAEPCSTCFGSGMVPSCDCEQDCCPTCDGLGTAPVQLDKAAEEPWWAHLDQAVMDAEASGRWFPDDGPIPF
jgi:hypothetical protein